MGGFKRFLLFVFSLAGLVCLGILGMPWFGYGGRQLTFLYYLDSFWIVLGITLTMTVCFLVFNLGRALFSSKHKDTIEVMSLNGGEITVTKSAVASQATHIVEALGLGTTKDVHVEAAKNDQVDVDVKVVPNDSIDVTAQAPVLHDALVTGLSAMCGEKLGSINIEFLEPKHGSSLVVIADDDGVQTDASVPDVVQASTEDAQVEANDNAQNPDATGDITIPMRAEKSE